MNKGLEKIFLPRSHRNGQHDNVYNITNNEGNSNLNTMRKNKCKSKPQYYLILVRKTIIKRKDKFHQRCKDIGTFGYS